MSGEWSDEEIKEIVEAFVQAIHDKGEDIRRRRIREEEEDEFWSPSLNSACRTLTLLIKEKFPLLSSLAEYQVRKVHARNMPEYFKIICQLEANKLSEYDVRKLLENFDTFSLWLQ